MDFKDKKVAIYAVLGLIFAGFLLWFLISGFKSAPGVTPPGDTGSATVLPVPDDFVVPGVNSTGTGAGAPVSVQSTGGQAGIDSRVFNINIDKNIISPDTVAVYLNDLITLNFSATDKDYDMTQPDNGIRWTVKKGGTKTVPFQGLSPGKFMYYCVSCGGPESGPVGYIVVVPKK